MSNKNFTYKLRAECIADVHEFYRQMNAWDSIDGKWQTTQTLPFPDVVLTFVSRFELDGIKRMLRQIVDGHVMLETVALESDYTGERRQ